MKLKIRLNACINMSLRLGLSLCVSVPVEHRFIGSRSNIRADQETRWQGWRGQGIWGGGGGRRRVSDEGFKGFSLTQETS
jgi:hypothetical protein